VTPFGFCRRVFTAATRKVADLSGERLNELADMVLERWDKTATVVRDRRVMNELVSLRFVEDHRNAVVLGPVGVGRPFSRTRSVTWRIYDHRARNWRHLDVAGMEVTLRYYQRPIFKTRDPHLRLL
jgi:hypothetical protein